MTESDGEAQHLSFGMTMYPGPVLPEPEVAVADLHWSGGAWIDLNYREQNVPGDEAPDDAVTTVPEDAVFHELEDADPGDPESLVQLMRALGGDVVPVQRERWRDVISPHRGDGVRPDQLAVYADVVSTHAERMGAPAVEAAQLEEAVPAFGGPTHPASRVHVAEVSMRVWSLQAVRRALTREIEVCRQDWGDFAEDYPHPAQRVEIRWLSSAFALMLRTFSPHVTLQLGGYVVSERPGKPSTALEVTALQLANSLSRQDNYKTCRRCRRVFSRQRGRAQYSDTHRRSDAVYCSSRCAQAAAQHSYRERKRRGSSGGE